MNTFVLATLTLSTLCLGGAFAAIVTARHVRLRRDAEDRRALGRVLEEVDRQLERLAAAEESSATAQIVGRLARLDERLGRLASQSAEWAAEAERTAVRLESTRAASAPPSVAELLEDASIENTQRAQQYADAAIAAEPQGEPSSSADEDDPELAALLAKFDDDAFSFRGAERARVRGAANHDAPTPQPSATATLERVPALVHSDAPISANTLTSCGGVEDDTDDEFELDDLVLLFHEDDQGESNDTSADDVALFDDVPVVAVTQQPASEPVRADSAASAAALPPSRLRQSLDEVRSLTERLSQPTRDRSERLRLVTELNDALARVRR